MNKNYKDAASFLQREEAKIWIDDLLVMDNGLFEGVTHITEDLLEKIYAFKSNVFIVPDEWDNSAATIRNAKHWMNVHKPNLPEIGRAHV